MDFLVCYDSMVVSLVYYELFHLLMFVGSELV